MFPRLRHLLDEFVEAADVVLAYEAPEGEVARVDAPPAAAVPPTAPLRPRDRSRREPPRRARVRRVGAVPPVDERCLAPIRPAPASARRRFRA